MVKFTIKVTPFFRREGQRRSHSPHNGGAVVDERNHQETNRLRNSQAALFELPEELIAQILEFVPKYIVPFHMGQISTHLIEQLHPGEVCSELRRIWISTPRCWSSLLLYLQSVHHMSNGHLQLLRLFLERSGSECPLDLGIVVNDQISKKLPTSLARGGGEVILAPPVAAAERLKLGASLGAASLLAKHWSRCRSLAMTGHVEWGIPWDEIGPLPHLRDLAVIMQAAGNYSSEPTIPFLSSSNPSVLNSLYIDYRQRGYQYPGPLSATSALSMGDFTALKVLHLDGQLEWPSWSKFILQCPNVEHVTLGNNPVLLPEWGMSFGKLKSLRLEFYIPNLEGLAAPTLVQLKILSIKPADRAAPRLRSPTTEDVGSLHYYRFPLLRRLLVPPSMMIPIYGELHRCLPLSLLSTVEDLILLPISSAQILSMFVDAMCDEQTRSVQEGESPWKLRLFAIAGDLGLEDEQNQDTQALDQVHDVKATMQKFLASFPSASFVLYTPTRIRYCLERAIGTFLAQERARLSLRIWTSDKEIKGLWPDHGDFELLDI